MGTPFYFALRNRAMWPLLKKTCGGSAATLFFVFLGVRIFMGSHFVDTPLALVAALYREQHLSLALPRSVERCGMGTLFGVGKDGVKIMPLKCKSWQCPKCAPLKRAQWRRVANRGRANKLLTLTCDPANFESPLEALEAMNKAWSKLVEKMRADYGDVQYLRVWEFHKSGYPHIHALLRTERYIPHGWISATWARLQIGYIVDIRAIEEGQADRVGGYISKYLHKGFADACARYPNKRLINKSRYWLLDDSQDKLEEEVEAMSWFYTRESPIELIHEVMSLWGGDLKKADAGNWYQLAVEDWSKIKPGRKLSGKLYCNVAEVVRSTLLDIQGTSHLTQVSKEEVKELLIQQELFDPDEPPSHK